MRLFGEIMNFLMSGFIRAISKIRKAIIIFYSVYMVYDFRWPKIAPNMLFHNKATSFYIAIRMFMRMIRTFYINIAIVFVSPALPRWTKPTRTVRKFFAFSRRYVPYLKSSSWNETGLFSFIPSRLPLLRNRFTFNRAIFSSFFSRRINNNVFSTFNTILNHCTTSSNNYMMQLLKSQGGILWD